MTKSNLEVTSDKSLKSSQGQLEKNQEVEGKVAPSERSSLKESGQALRKLGINPKSGTSNPSNSDRLHKQQNGSDTRSSSILIVDTDSEKANPSIEGSNKKADYHEPNASQASNEKKTIVDENDSNSDEDEDQDEDEARAEASHETDNKIVADVGKASDDQKLIAEIRADLKSLLLSHLKNGPKKSSYANDGRQLIEQIISHGFGNTDAELSVNPMKHSDVSRKSMRNSTAESEQALPVMANETKKRSVRMVPNNNNIAENLTTTTTTTASPKLNKTSNKFAQHQKSELKPDAQFKPNTNEPKKVSTKNESGSQKDNNSNNRNYPLDKIDKAETIMIMKNENNNNKSDSSHKFDWFNNPFVPRAAHRGEAALNETDLTAAASAQKQHQQQHRLFPNQLQYNDREIGAAFVGCLLLLLMFIYFVCLKCCCFCCFGSKRKARTTSSSSSTLTSSTMAGWSFASNGKLTSNNYKTQQESNSKIDWLSSKLTGTKHQLKTSDISKKNVVESALDNNNQNQLNFPYQNKQFVGQTTISSANTSASTGNLNNSNLASRFDTPTWASNLHKSSSFNNNNNNTNTKQDSSSAMKSLMKFRSSSNNNNNEDTNDPDSKSMGKKSRNSNNKMTDEPQLGRIKFKLDYDFNTSILTVNLLEGRDLAAMDLCGSSDPYVKVFLLPDKRHYEKTKVHKKTLNPQFNETFQFQIGYADLINRTLLLMVYDHDRFSRHDTIGQATIPMDSLDLSVTREEWRDLKPHNDSNGSSVSLQ